MRVFRSVRRIFSMSLITGCIGSLFLVAPPCALAQESNFGISAPITLTGGALYSHRRQQEDPES
jgi:hypothetical protein